MNNFKNSIIASIAVIVISMSLSAFAALSPTETQCANYLNNYSADNMPSEAVTALTYCANNNSCANGLSDAVSDCSAKLGQWQVKQAIQTSTTAPTKTTTTGIITSPAQAPKTTVPVQTQKPAVAIPATPAAAPTTITTDTNQTNINQTNTKKTDKPSINWF